MGLEISNVEKRKERKEASPSAFHCHPREMTTIVTTPFIPETLDDVQPSLDGHGPLPISECHCILMVQHARYEADTQRLTSLGLPSMYSRLTLPTTSREEANKLHLRKQRLQMQISKKFLQTATDPQEQVSVLQQVQRRSASRRKLREEVGTTTTFFDLLEGDLVGVQSRTQLGITVKLLFEGRGLQSPTLFYPRSNVQRAPKWAKCKTDEYAAAPAQWATITFASPSPGSSLEGGGVKYTKESEKQCISTLQASESAEQIVARLQPPDTKSCELMQQFLRHLASRGVVWTRAGQGTVPSATNRDPRQRPEFAVLGLFPKVSFHSAVPNELPL